MGDDSPGLNVRPATATPSDASPAARGTARAGAGGWLALPVLMAGTFLIVLDFFIVNVAIPSLQAGLRAGSGAVEWVVAGYGLTFAVFLVSAGRLGDRVGRRRAFSIGLALFVLASAACGLAPSAPALVGAGQGLCITPLTATVLSHTDPQRAGAVSGALSTMQQVGSALGVAVTGVVFFGALGGGYARAFERGLLQLACLAVAVAALTRLLPRAAASRAL